MASTSGPSPNRHIDEALAQDQLHASEKEKSIDHPVEPHLGEPAVQVDPQLHADKAQRRKRKDRQQVSGTQNPQPKIGNQLDLIDEVVAGDTKIYVEDVKQVEPLKIQGMTPADVSMIQLISQGIDLTTVDQTQQGVAQKYVTARAAVAADERARQLKGVFFMFLESLWLQKVRLRVPNILLAYTRPRLVKVIGSENTDKYEERVRTFNVKGANLSDGKRGTLGVSFMNEGEMRDRRTELFQGVEKQENEAAGAGEAMEKVILPYGYFDELSFDLEIIPETLWQSSKSIGMALFVEKLAAVREAFPELFAQNKQIFL